MWTEPLSATSGVIAPGQLMVVVKDGTSTNVMGVLVKFYLPTKCAALGEIQTAANGSPAQHVKAFTLLIRECVRRARIVGIEHGLADVHPRARRLAERVAARVDGAGPFGQWVGRLADLEASIDQRTRADGTLRTPMTAAELAEVDTL